MRIKNRVGLCFLLFFLSITASPAYPFFVNTKTSPHDNVLGIIVIDAGHGGEDTGAIGPSGIKEKNINLGVARKLGQLISQRTNAAVVLTRSDDTFIALDKRTDIANRNKADLFISIHTNAAYRKGASGIETYFLNFNPSDEDAQRAAAFENAVASVGNNKPDMAYADDIKMILMDMAEASVLNESSLLAEIIQENLCDALAVENRGVKQAPFVVLMGATMPAVLVEVGFLSNAEEEKRLASDKAQEAIANAIFKGILKFERMSGMKMEYARE